MPRTRKPSALAAPTPRQRKLLAAWRRHEREVGGPPPLPWLRREVEAPTAEVLATVEELKLLALLPADARFGVLPEGGMRALLKRWAEGPGLFE